MPQSIGATAATHAAVFAPLVGAGRADLVERRLTDAITLGVLPNGERLPSESLLARQFGVAVVTAREALESLRGKGLVTTRRGRDGGSFVTWSAARSALMVDERLRDITRIEIRDLGVHYAAIAAMSAEVAADRASVDDIEGLRELTDAIDSGNEGAARRGMGRFRLEIAALSQSSRLVREEIRLQAEFGGLLWLCLREQDYRDRCLEQNRRIIDAIEGLDADVARHITTTQVNDAVEWLIDAKAEREREGTSA